MLRLVATDVLLTALFFAGTYVFYQMLDYCLKPVGNRIGNKDNRVVPNHALDGLPDANIRVRSTTASFRANRARQLTLQIRGQVDDLISAVKAAWHAFESDWHTSKVSREEAEDYYRTHPDAHNPPPFK